MRTNFTHSNTLKQNGMKFIVDCNLYFGDYAKMKLKKFNNNCRLPSGVCEDRILLLEFSKKIGYNLKPFFAQ